MQQSTINIDSLMCVCEINKEMGVRNTMTRKLNGLYKTIRTEIRKGVQVSDFITVEDKDGKMAKYIEDVGNMYCN